MQTNRIVVSGRDRAKWVADSIEPLRDKFQDADKQIRRTVRDYPLLTLAGAVLAGYIVGRILVK